MIFQGHNALLSLSFILYFSSKLSLIFFFIDKLQMHQWILNPHPTTSALPSSYKGAVLVLNNLKLINELS